MVMALAAGVCLTATAKPKKKTKKSKATVAVVDTISASDFSLHAGRANSQGLKPYLASRMEIDTTYMADFMKGFEQGQLTEADKREKARLAGIEIRRQVEEQMIPQLSKQMDETKNLLDHERFIEGFAAGVMEQPVAGVSMDSTSTLVRKQLAYYHEVNMERKYGANRKAGEDFLKANAKKDSVVTTKSGLQYKVLTKGTGEIPTASQRVKVNYRGTLIDGTEFDSSYKRNQPATFACNQVIKGWTEALTLMPVGSKWMLYIPQELGYGDRESGQIPPFSTLVFEVELLSIEK